MIKKLRIKVVAYATVSIFLLLFIAFFAINIINFTIVANNADLLTQAIANDNGKFGSLTPPSPHQGEVQDKGFMEAPEMRASSRYFTVSIDKNGNASIVAFNLTEASMSEEDAILLAKKLQDKNVGWANKVYRYRVYQGENNLTYVTVVDETRELTPSFNVLWICLAVLLIGSLVSMGILIAVSKYMVKPIEDSDNKQKRFIKDATYALKSPVTIIEESNNLLKEKEDKELNKVIDEQLVKLNNIVNNMNTIAILKDEKKMLDEAFIANQELDKVLEKYKPLFENRNVDISIDVMDDINLNMDKELFRQIVKEILDNGAKYSKSRFSLRLEKVDERFILESINDVDGIEDGDYSRVFERFYRLDNERTRSVSGNGLGLSIVYEITHKYHGRVSAKAKNNEFFVKVEI